MISKLKGILDSTGEDWAVIDVNGVGYHVTCSARTLARLPETGSALSLEIETKMSEDAIRLYGFRTADERAWFRLLQTVQGVGAKVALALLALFEPAELTLAVARGDKAALGKASGVGPKLAQRLVMELKDKAPAPVGGFTASPLAPAPMPVKKGPEAEAVSALVNLGWKPAEAAAAVERAQANLGPEAPVEALIRAGLKEMARA